MQSITTRLYILKSLAKLFLFNILRPTTSVIITSFLLIKLYTIFRLFSSVFFQGIPYFPKVLYRFYLIFFATTANLPSS